MDTTSRFKPYTKSNIHQAPQWKSFTSETRHAIEVTVRGPSMSAFPGKVVIDGVTQLGYADHSTQNTIRQPLG